MRLFAQLIRQRRWLLGLLGVLLIGATAGVAWATIPGQDGVIHGCYLRSGGTLRVIDASVTNCKKTEVALNWNQSGPQGPQGDPGQPGQPGQPGPGAGYTQFAAGEGGAGAIQLPEDPADPVQVLTLDVPSDWVADNEGNWQQGTMGLVTTVSLLFWNKSPVMAHPGCTVLSDQGGFGDGHMYIAGMDSADVSPTTTGLTFQATSQPNQPPPSVIYLTCSVGSDHPPLPQGTAMDMRVLTAEMSVVPRNF